MSSAAYQPVIGLEVHVQLRTATKLFCGSRNQFGAPPNTHVCPVCLGLPGALPVLNARAVDLAVSAALALDCSVHGMSVFARKNYFYPDLPKGYQITQFERPLATGGRLEGGAGDAAYAVRIRRIHLEEDAGKSVHDRFPGATAIDLNRAGVPLIEIVTEPDLGSPAAARAFLVRLKQILQYVEVSDCDMEKGTLRVDANVSVRSPGSGAPGTRTEIKNMNSFASVERALHYELDRQTAVVSGGGSVTAETLLWDAARGESRPLRGKEDSRDYRYFPDPDLPPLVLDADRITRVRATLPELPAVREARFRDYLGLSNYDATVLAADRWVADYFEAVVAAGADAKAAANWVMSDVLAWSNRTGLPVSALPVPPAGLAELIALVAGGAISSSGARTVLARMIDTQAAAPTVVEELGLRQIRDDQRIETWVDEVLAAHSSEVERYRAGDAKLLDFFMGQVMKRSLGRADPRLATELLRARLDPA